MDCIAGHKCVLQYRAAVRLGRIVSQYTSCIVTRWDRRQGCIAIQPLHLQHGAGVGRAGKGEGRVGAGRAGAQARSTGDAGSRHSVQGRASGVATRPAGACDMALGWPRQGHARAA